MQSVATVDLAVNSHWLSQKQAVAVEQRGKPNFHWLPRGPSAASREALPRLMLRLAQETPRQGQLIEEEEVVGEREAFVNSSGGTLKLA